MVKIKTIKPEDIPAVSRKQKTPQQQFEDEIRRYLKKAGFTIEGGGYLARGADIIASAEGERIIVQCKCAEKNGTSYRTVESLKDEYSTKVRRMKALAAILAFKNYTIGRFGNLKEKSSALNDDKVAIWEYEKEITYYKNVIKALGEWAKYPLLGDLGCKKDFADPLHVPTVKVVQDGVEFCMFKISPEVLLKIADVFRKVRNPEAYQRMVNSSRIKNDIAKDFLERVDKPTFPTNLVCVFRGNAKFDEAKGEMLIPLRYSSVWIVDGQHRLYGFCHVSEEKRKNFELLCAGFNIDNMPNSKLDKSDQAQMFSTINEKAKRVSKDLLIEIALKTGTADRRMKVVDLLRRKERRKEIFKNKIKSVGTSGKIDIATFVFTAPMKRLVGDMGPLSKYYGKARQEKIISPKEEEKFIANCANVLEKYFILVKSVYPVEWDDPETFILATDRGIRGLLRLLRWILEYSNGLRDEKKVKACLKELNFDFHSEKLKRMYLGEGGADSLEDLWVGNIQTKYQDFGPRPRITEIQIEPGEQVRAKKEIKEKLSRFDGEVVGELPHIDATTFEYLGYVPVHCPIKIFIDGAKEREKCIERAEEFSKGRARLEIKEIRRQNNKAFIHDRWLSDGDIMIDFGQDLKNESIGKNRHKIRVIDRASLVPSYQTFYKNWRATSEELKLRGGKWEWFFKPKRY